MQCIFLKLKMYSATKDHDFLWGSSRFQKRNKKFPKNHSITVIASTKLETKVSIYFSQFCNWFWTSTIFLPYLFQHQKIQVTEHFADNALESILSIDPCRLKILKYFLENESSILKLDFQCQKKRSEKRGPSWHFA